MAKKTIRTSISLCLIFFSLPLKTMGAERITPGAREQIRLVQKNGRVFLELCEGIEKCNVLGSPNGYSPNQLRPWLSMQEPGFREHLPLMLSISAGVLVILALPLAPLGLTLGVGTSLFALFTWSWLNHPQVKAAMPNEVIRYWTRSDGSQSLRKQVESFLGELDRGIATEIRNPAIVSQVGVPAKDHPVTESEPSSSMNAIPIPAP
jgi:hypothetical protein